MLASAQPQDVDLLGRVVDAAAKRARGALGAPVALRRLEGVEIREDIADLHFDARCVRKDDDGLTVVVMVTGNDEAGRECMVAAGRFTFATFVAPSASIVTRLARVGSINQ